MSKVGNRYTKGHPARFVMSFEDREKMFWAMGESQGDCILWSGYKNKGGYGQTTYQRKTLRTHQIAYLLTYGEIPEGLHIDHLCSVRACMNPAHLEAVTQLENGRRAGERQTHCINGHEYTAENTRRQKTGRSCATCYRAQSKAFHEAERRAQGARINSRLTKEKVIEARYLYATTDMGYHRLAKKFGVSTTAIRFAIRGLTWKGITT